MGLTDIDHFERVVKAVQDYLGHFADVDTHSFTWPCDHTRENSLRFDVTFILFTHNRKVIASGDVPSNELIHGLFIAQHIGGLWCIPNQEDVRIHITHRSHEMKNDMWRSEAHLAVFVGGETLKKINGAAPRVRQVLIKRVPKWL